MAQTIEGFVGTALDDARMSPIHWRVFALIAAEYFFCRRLRDSRRCKAHSDAAIPVRLVRAIFDRDCFVAVLLLVTGPLTSGNVTDDSDLTVSVGLPGQGFGANVGDTVQLYNGSDTTNPLGAHILTTEDFNVGAVDVQTGVLPDGAIDLTVRLVDPAGNASVVSAAFAFTVVCFARGTHLLTSTGEVPVEALQPGMPMVANDGTVASVKWIGRRRIDLTAHPRPETVAPIRIRRGAFADNMPHTDLLVSPDHAIFVDGKLICARQLINGTTIRQEKGWTVGGVFPRRAGRACDPARRGPAGGELPQHRQPRLLRQLGRSRWCCIPT